MVNVEVYFSPVCPHCPGAKRLVADVASRYGGLVDMEEIDMFTPDGIRRGMANNVMSVPAVFIDGRQAFVGFPFSEEALVASIEEALKR